MALRRRVQEQVAAQAATTAAAARAASTSCSTSGWQERRRAMRTPCSCRRWTCCRRCRWCLPVPRRCPRHVQPPFRQQMWLPLLAARPRLPAAPAPSRRLLSACARRRQCTRHRPCVPLPSSSPTSSSRQHPSRPCQVQHVATTQQTVQQEAQRSVQTRRQPSLRAAHGRSGIARRRRRCRSSCMCSTAWAAAVPAATSGSC